MSTGTIPGEPTSEQLTTMPSGMRGRVRPDTVVDDSTGTIIDNLPNVPDTTFARPRSYYDQMSQQVYPIYKNIEEDIKPPPPKPLPEIPDLVVAHRKFFSSLEALSNEHPAVLAKFILKYAISIQESDPLIYNKLVSIAKSIKV